jgi:hypothetical protein
MFTYCYVFYDLQNLKVLIKIAVAGVEMLHVPAASEEPRRVENYVEFNFFFDFQMGWHIKFSVSTYNINIHEEFNFFFQKHLLRTFLLIHK